MAIASRVLATVVERTDTPEPRADGVYRAEQRVDLSVRSGKGGGKSAVHWGPTPLINLMIGIGVAYPATAAAVLVPQYRTLRFYRRTIDRRVYKDGQVVSSTHQQGSAREMLFGGDVDSHPLHLRGETLADDLEQIIERGALSDAARAKIGSAGLAVTLVMGRPSAVIRFATPGGDQVSDFYVMSREPALPGLESLADYWPKPASIQSSATLTSATIEMLVDLLRDTLEHQGAPLLSPTGSGRLPSAGIENAALPQAASSSLPEKPKSGSAAHSSLNNCITSARARASSSGLPRGSCFSSPRSGSHETDIRANP